MQVKIKSKNLNLSDGQKDLIETKVLKLQNFADRLGDESAEFRVEVRHEKSRKASDAYICQLTIFAPSAVIRSETRNETIENAVDECMDKIKGQIEKYKSKMHRTGKKGSEPQPVVQEEGEFEIPNVLRRKRFSDSSPLTEDEAIEKMELVGHGFFLFNNADTGRFSVVYKRDDGYYGIIEPKHDND
jgi:putative sigma-54 modulation protein